MHRPKCILTVSTRLALIINHIFMKPGTENNLKHNYNNNNNNNNNMNSLFMFRTCMFFISFIFKSVLRKIIDLKFRRFRQT